MKKSFKNINLQVVLGILAICSIDSTQTVYASSNDREEKNTLTLKVSKDSNENKSQEEVIENLKRQIENLKKSQEEVVEDLKGQIEDLNRRIVNANSLVGGNGIGDLRRLLNQLNNKFYIYSPSFTESINKLQYK